jgi:DNA mismatch endonuclease, patch repair protein
MDVAQVLDVLLHREERLTPRLKPGVCGAIPIKKKGNRSTEAAVEAGLMTARIRGWTKHPKDIPGCPDFYFPKARLAVFVDGCFWHLCPKCGRPPSSNLSYWGKKLDANRRRDNRTRRRLRASGHHVMRIWEHDAKGVSWLPRLERMLHKHLRRPPKKSN